MQRFGFGSISIGLCFIAVLGACGDDGNSGTAGTGVAGTMAGTGSGGVMAGTVAGTGTGGTGVAGTMAGTGSGGTMAGTGSGGTMAGTGSGGTGGGFTPGSPTWSAIWEEIIVGTGCNGGPLCHGGAVGGLTMIDKDESYTALINQPAMGTNLTGMGVNCVDTGMTRVIPGQPDMSLLVLKVEQAMPPCGTQMPATGALSAEQQMQIRMWVQNGAMND